MKNKQTKKKKRKKLLHFLPLFFLQKEAPSSYSVSSKKIASQLTHSTRHPSQIWELEWGDS